MAALGFMSTIVIGGAVPANAAVVTVDGTVEALRVDYIQFTHFGGALDIFTTGIVGPSGAELDDPMIRLFVDDNSPVGSLTGTQVAVADDGTNLDPLISLGSLGAGNYILAVGRFDLEETEARSGVATTPLGNSDYSTTFTSATAIQLANTPVPGPIVGAGLPALMAFGGFVAWRRRKGGASV